MIKKTLIKNYKSFKSLYLKNQQTRRDFLRTSIGILLAVPALILGIPFITSIIAPVYKRKKSRFVKIGEVASLPKDQPVSLEFHYEGTDAFIRQVDTHNVWVVKKSDSDLMVFSPICTHLGCRFNWDGQASQFICPCHNSHFSINGQVLSGPAPRPLDTLPYKIEGGNLYVKWEIFEPGISKKVEI